MQTLKKEIEKVVGEVDIERERVEERAREGLKA